MGEQRKNTRLELHSSLMVKEMTTGESIPHEIEVIDVSKKGIGFACNEPLLIGHAYEGYLRIWTQDVIHAFFEIVRIEKLEHTYHYGGIFIGMPEIDASKIGVYEMFEESKKGSI